MKIGEKLKYKARKYLYQIEQNVNYNNQKKQSEVNQEIKIKQAVIEEEKKYYTSQKVNHDYYDVYLNDHQQQSQSYGSAPYNNYQYPKDNYYNQYPTHNEYKTTKKKNNNILGTLDEIEEYLEGQMEKFKK